MKKFLILFFIFLIVIILGFFLFGYISKKPSGFYRTNQNNFSEIIYDQNKPQSIDDMNNCTKDNECYYITREVCCCSEHTAINKKYKKVFDENVDEYYKGIDCDDPSCTGVCGMSYYVPVGARCEKGRCISVCVPYDEYDQDDFTLSDC